MTLLDFGRRSIQFLFRFMSKLSVSKSGLLIVRELRLDGRDIIPIFSTLFGRTSSVMDLQPLSTLFSRLVTDFGMLKFFNPVQLENAPSPIDETLSGTFISVSF